MFFDVSTIFNSFFKGHEIETKRDISDVPTELVLSIFSFLEIADLGAASQVCRK
jgi:F-box-like